jgi:hypothetical protein
VFWRLFFKKNPVAKRRQIFLNADEMTQPSGSRLPIGNIHAPVERLVTDYSRTGIFLKWRVFPARKIFSKKEK